MFREIFLIVFVALIYAHMPVNAILFLSFRQFKHFILDCFVHIVCVFCVRACARCFILKRLRNILFFNVAHAFVAFLYFLFSFLFKLLYLPVLSHFVLIF